jgi:hypothetical protein
MRSAIAQARALEAALGEQLEGRGADLRSGVDVRPGHGEQPSRPVDYLPHGQ